MFSQQKHSWCSLARMVTQYSRMSVKQLSIKATTSGIPINPHCLSTNSTLHKPPTGLQNGKSANKENEGNNQSTISKCLGFVGLMSILGTKVKEENKEQLGEEKIIHMIKLAKLSQERKEFKKSEQLLHLALRAAYEIQHHDAQKYIIDDMANNAYEAGDFKKAEKLFVDLIKQLVTDGVAQSHNSIIHISAKLANLYAMFHEEVKACEGFNFCIHHLEAKIKKGEDDFDTLALYSLILSWFGDCVHRRGDFTQSLALFKKSHEISVKINGKHHPHSLLQLNNMAAAFTLMNRLEDAVDCLNTALVLAQEVQMDDGMKDLPYYFINLANVYLTQVEKSAADAKELLKMAENSCREALKCAKVVDNRDALIQARKCMKQINSYQTL